MFSLSVGEGWRNKLLVGERKRSLMPSGESRLFSSLLSLLAIVAGEILVSSLLPTATLEESEVWSFSYGGSRFLFGKEKSKQRLGSLAARRLPRKSVFEKKKMKTGKKAVRQHVQEIKQFLRSELAILLPGPLCHVSDPSFMFSLFGTLPPSDVRKKGVK